MDPTSELLRVLSYSIRRRIIKCLDEHESLSYNDLLKLINIENHSELKFHLRAMKDLIEQKSLDEYRLTDKGRVAAGLLNGFSFALAKTTQDLLSSPTKYVQNLVFGDHAIFLYDTETDKKALCSPI